jgi:hypothetical protein
MKQVHRHKLPLWLLVISLQVFNFSAAGQENESSASVDALTVHGIIWDSEDVQDRFPLVDVSIEVKADGKRYPTFTSDSLGNYGMILDLDVLWSLTWKKAGLYIKTVEIDTRNIPLEVQSVGFRMHIDIILTKATSESNKKILKEYPIGKAKYDPVADAIGFDWDYTAKIQAMLE